MSDFTDAMQKLLDRRRTAQTQEERDEAIEDMARLIRKAQRQEFLTPFDPKLAQLPRGDAE